jgi:hypothetical protein
MVGSVIDLYTKGWLPYTLRWRIGMLPPQKSGQKSHPHTAQP